MFLIRSERLCPIIQSCPRCRIRSTTTNLLPGPDRVPLIFGLNNEGKNFRRLTYFAGRLSFSQEQIIRTKSLITSKVALLQNGKDFTAEGFEELYGIATNGAVLIRPDGYVGARWSQLAEGFPEQLASSLASILGANN